MLRLCGLCGYFKRDKKDVSCGWCLVGQRKEYDNTTFSTNTCSYFRHRRLFDPKKVKYLAERQLEQDGYA